MIEVHKLSDMFGGWFVGNFSPAVAKSKDFEACVKKYKAGEIEDSHYQRVATEITVIIEGIAKFDDLTVTADSIVTIPPGIACGFKAVTDVTLVAIKFPSLPDDKVLS